METVLQYDHASILIVDDNPKNLQVLGNLLKAEGYEVEFALGGPAALEWLSQRSFDLVLLDIMMPDLDGFEVCNEIKKKPGLKDIPVIFITANTDTESITKGFKAGGMDYITKPFIPDELLARVRSQINIHKSKQRIIAYLNEIKQKNKNIRDSIEYALYIQKAVMNPSRLETDLKPDNFILYQPKDIVSGDFYWYFSEDNFFILAVMDCTGHGVPGAFMSILGMTLLNEIVVRDGITKPDLIMNNLRTRLINSLGQNAENFKIKDGIEGSVILYENSTNKLYYSASFNPLILIRDNTISTLKADRMPIGYSHRNDSFTLNSFDIAAGDKLYLFSDGITDQFGGPDKRKLMFKRFSDILQKIHYLPMQEQKKFLNDFLADWMGDFEQTDDITVAGINFI